MSIGEGGILTERDLFLIKKKAFGLSWEKIKLDYNSKFLENKSANALRCRHDRIVKRRPDIVRKIVNSADNVDAGELVDHNSSGEVIEGKSSVEYLSNGTVTHDKLIEICDGEEITPDVIMAAHNIDSKKWEVVSYRNNYWHSQVKGGKRLIMYQSRVTVKPLSDKLQLTDIEDFYKHMSETYVRPSVNVVTKKGSLMAEVNIADLHLGKLCWRGDTGNNFDYKIARDVFYDLVGRICSEIKNMAVEKILFVWSNDFFNYDTRDKTTTAGTPQDTDVRWQKLFNVGVETLVGGIDMLAEIAPVTTFYTPSNHDEVTSYHATKYLAAWFRNDNRVEVDTGVTPRKYIPHGKCLVGFTHGNKEKAPRLANLMAIEAREMWGKAKYCEMHTAHLHSEHAIMEVNGVIVRRISSPTATDTYHAVNAYVGAIRKAQTFIWDKEDGLVNTINTPVRA